MEAVDLSELAHAWIARYEAIDRDGPDSSVAKTLYWAYEAVDKVVSDQPRDALDLVVSMLRNCSNPAVISNIAAGPMEDLLSRHGSAIIEQVEREAKSNTVFRHMLGEVWPGSMVPAIWNRVEKAAKESM